MMSTLAPLLLLFLAGFSMTGIWTGQLTNKYGEIEDVSFRFTDTATGGFIGKMYGDNESTPIQDGKVEGDRVTFSVTTAMNGSPRTMAYEGRIVDGKLQVERRRIYNPGEPIPQNPPPPVTITLKRVL